MKSPVRRYRSRPVEYIPPPPAVPGFSRGWIRSRNICFIKEDWEAVGDALLIACPYAQYKRHITPPERILPEPPEPPISRHICDLVQPVNRFAVDISVQFYGGPQAGHDPEDPARTIAMAPSFSIRDAGRIYPADHEPEQASSGRLDFWLESNNADHIAFMRQIFSLFGRFSSNRHQMTVSYPDYEDYRHKVVGDLWLGHEAIRWALEDPKRILDYRTYSNPNEPIRGSGIRPIAEKWASRWPHLAGGMPAPSGG